MTHAQVRARERFGVSLEVWQLQYLLKKCRTGEGTLVAEDSAAKHFLVRYMGKNFRIVTNSNFTKVITVLRPGMR